MDRKALQIDEKILEQDMVDCHLELDGVSVGYKDRTIVQDINLEIKSGEIVTIIGPNGSGKSTILKTILRELGQQKGCIYLDKKLTTSFSLGEMSKKMSMVMTHRPYTELMSCRELVATGRYPYTDRMGILRDSDWEKVDEAIRLVGAEDTAVDDFNSISDGQKQRVLIARAICQEPELLILDEPTSFLDIRYKLDILRIIRELSRTRGITVIMSLHELELARSISDRIICVGEGKIDKIGSPDQIFRDGYIPHLYGIDESDFDESTGCIRFNEGERGYSLWQR